MLGGGGGGVWPSILRVKAVSSCHLQGVSAKQNARSDAMFSPTQRECFSFALFPTALSSPLGGSGEGVVGVVAWKPAEPPAPNLFMAASPTLDLRPFAQLTRFIVCFGFREHLKEPALPTKASGTAQAAHVRGEKATQISCPSFSQRVT